MHPKQAEEIEGFRHQSKQLSDGALLPEVVAFIKNEVPNLGNQLFLLDHIPEQGEDVYIFVSSGSLVIHVEVPRQSGDSQITQIVSWQSFRREKHSKLTNRKLEAIDVILSQA